MKKTNHVTIKIPEELVADMDKLKGKYGFRSRGEIAKEAIRRLLEQYSSQLELEHFNLNEHGVVILDRSLNPPKGRLFQVYFRPEGVLCEFCQSDKCRHVKFSLGLPKVQDILSKKGWEIPTEELTDEEIKAALDELAKKR